MDIQKMIREAQEMQKNLMQAQKDLANVEVKGASGNGLVEITMSAQGEVKNIKIGKDAVNPDDVETLEDLVLTAFRDAYSKAADVSKEKLSKLTGGKGLLPF